MKMNQKDYKFYVVNAKIESGWSYKSDAYDQILDNMEIYLKPNSKVITKLGLIRFGINPDNNDHWIITGKETS